MKTLNLSNYTLQIYDSIEELPITNFNMYNRYLLIDSGIGSNLEDIDTHIERLVKYIKMDSKLAIQELLNLRQSLYFVNQSISPKYMAFAALIYSINGIRTNEISENELHNILSKVTNLTNNQISDIVSDIKKKLETELSLFFAQFDSPEYKEVYDKLRERILVQLDGIIYDVDNTDKIQDIDTYFLLLADPKEFNGKDSIEIKHVRDFENACLIISQETNLNAKLMTTIQFMLALELIKKKHSTTTKRSKTGKHGQ